ncbi:PREDICTED: facilitated trehalose transporter Tret1-like [Papilio polytes]|uniref:facilitated trehalose transporter Tret1-like n=1 Tax=Papilio polytes TaxID=76194 RepID=UPI0006763E05|nr:PREDICTED: facilitated trehalose transporter Tret1-like [Papilio polytes]
MVIKVQMDQMSPAASRFRSIASQIISSLSPNFLLLDLGMAISFPTIALPVLLNAREGLSVNDVQASWFGSLSSLTQPFGAFISGPIVDFLGRRRANFVVNLPHIIAWILMYFSWDLPSLFMANALLGLGTGIMEAPINAYVGEISEPSIRGSLSTFTQLFLSLGTFAMYFLGAVVDWRSAAIISLAIPISSMALVLLVPETPVWLLSRGREKDALNSLCKLRGWTTPEHVREEFDQLVDYSKKLQNCVICYKLYNRDTQTCEHVTMNPIRRSMYKFRYVMLAKETLRPLIFVMVYFMFYVMSGLTPIKPNMVNICGAFGMAQDGKDIVLNVGIITICCSVLVIASIRYVGKRKMAITSLLGTAISCAALSVYAKYNLDDSVFSYDTSTFPKETSYVPLILFYMMAFFTGFNLPWVLVGEVFPFRSRASAQGIAAASNYVFTFLGAKSLIDLEVYGQLWGTFAVYAAFGFVGTIFLYFFLPETEGMSLEDIEVFFNGDKIQTFANDPVINTLKRLKRRNINQ